MPTRLAAPPVSSCFHGALGLLLLPLVVALSTTELAAAGKRSSRIGRNPAAEMRPGTPMERELARRLTRVPEDEAGLIRLPLRIVVARGLTLHKKGIPMNDWITDDAICQQVIPELNRIWKPARIEWTVESLIGHPISPTVQEERRDGLQRIMESRRDENGRSDPARVPLIKAFFDPDHEHPVAQTVHLFPYLGTTSQGFAAGGGLWAYLGIWTDKPSRGARPPRRTLLTEDPPMKIGSLGRTLAHELGHNLGLSHPAQNARPTGRLMGGRRQGYLLTPEEIAAARSNALNKARRIMKWSNPQDH
jgi:hypothetical protein